MSIISEIKCARCDRKYSGVRSRCPYCGARRIGRGKYSEDGDNSKGKMLIGVLIMSVLVVAAGVLLFTTPQPDDYDLGPALAASPPASMPSDTEVDTVPGLHSIPDPTPTPEEPAPAEPELEVRTVTIVYGSQNRSMSDFTARVGERTPLRVRIEPIGITEEIEWTSSNTAVFEVVRDNPEGTAATVHGVGSGTATLTVTVGGVSRDCIVRIR